MSPSDVDDILLKLEREYGLAKRPPWYNDQATPKQKGYLSVAKRRGDITEEDYNQAIICKGTAKEAIGKIESAKRGNP